MKYILFTSFLGLVSFFGTSAEQPLYKECSKCSSIEQFEVAAKAESKLNKPLNVYVMNLDKGNIEKFKVSKVISGYRTIPGGGEPDGNGGKVPDRKIPIYSVSTTSYGVEQNVLNTFYALSSAKNSLKNSLAEMEADVVPTSIANSAWDLVGASSVQNSVSDHYNQYNGVLDKVVNLTNIAGQLSGIVEIDKVMIEVSFNDKSTAIFSLYAIINGKLIWDFEHGTDVDNNMIEPSLSTTRAEQYVFEKGGASVFSDFYDAATRAGVTFIGSSGSTGRVTCVNKGIGKYICTYTR
ncbi:hypothetical protein [Pseudoalteromonas arctica]|uniref:Uncharacterized protein n=1 Tax=Pseudoalteromonas arctica TaxID=394751 RepID=A0A7Y0DSY3_9GAMM|nr:hypothetical protein [Pseudoalteromonas arctica]NMM41009.1 hypothetical protein [Pseudoalteromonas arctica]